VVRTGDIPDRLVSEQWSVPKCSRITEGSLAASSYFYLPVCADEEIFSAKPMRRGKRHLGCSEHLRHPPPHGLHFTLRAVATGDHLNTGPCADPPADKLHVG
jgi:hypothetical protein